MHRIHIEVHGIVVEIESDSLLPSEVETKVKELFAFVMNKGISTQPDLRDTI